MREPSSGTLRSRLICPSSPLTDRKIRAYILAGRYGEDLRKKELSKLKKKKKPSRPLSLHSNSAAVKHIESFL